MILRPYQAKGLADIRGAFASGARRVLYVLPTGGGKTVIFVRLAEEYRPRRSIDPARTVIVAHRRELIRQASARLTVPHGVIAPGHAQTDHLIQVGSIQTLARRLDRLPKFDQIIFDEGHHAVAGQWRALLASQPQARILGVTATPQRLDGRGLAESYDVIVQGPSVADLIADGFLVPSRVFAPFTPDLSGVHTLAGDYKADELAAAVDKPALTGDAVIHYGRYCPGAPAVAFCVSVQHARNVAEAFRSEGWNAVAVDGSMPTAERDAALAGLADGSVAVVTSCELISEGLDIPDISAVLMMRPTQSLAMYLQMVGRGLRPAPGKESLIVLDHAGNTHRHGLATADREWSLAGIPKRTKTAPQVRQCPVCFAAHAPAPECPACGFSYIDTRQGCREGFEYVDGKLVEIVAPPVAPLPPLPPLREALSGCRSWDDVEAVRVARNYAPGWTDIIMQRFHIARRSANADFLDVSGIVSRAEAIKQGLKKCVTGEPCARGHVGKWYMRWYAPSESRVSRVHFTCADCTAERSRGFRTANPEKLREHDRARRAASSEKIREQTRAWRGANPEKVKKKVRAWRAANRERVREYDRAYKRRHRRAAQQDNAPAVDTAEAAD